MNKHIFITTAVPEDSLGITYVRRTTWLATYPNEKEGITKEDIALSFKKRTIEEEATARAVRIANNTDTMIWVAKSGDTIVGYIEAQKTSEKNRIRAFYVLPEYQHQGVGKELMNEALEWLGSDKEIICEVASYNQNAIAFYKKFGFEENGPTTNEAGKLPHGKEIKEIEMIRYPIV